MERKFSCKYCARSTFIDFVYTNNVDKCIFHSEKNDWFENQDKKVIWNEENVKFFWDMVAESVEEINTFKKNNKDTCNEMLSEHNYDTSRYYFSNVIFPTFVYEYNSLNDLPLSNVEKNDIMFETCIFIGDSDFRYLFKVKNIYFNNCEFIQNTSFSNINFMNKFIFEECRILGNIDFSNTEFNKFTSFYKSNFYGATNFDLTRFFDNADFSNTEFFNLDLSTFFYEREMKFINIVLDNLNRETARIVKDSFEQQNNFIEANKYYAKEMEAYEKELTPLNTWDWLVLKFHGITSEYAQNWLLPLVWILNVSFLYFLIDTKLYYSRDKILFGGFLFVVVFLIFSYLNKYLKNIFILFFTIILYSCFDINLDEIAKLINPFSKSQDLTFSLLALKVFIAYLAYQFIVSVRQNTRRK